MQKGRLMELTGNQKCDPALPNNFVATLEALKIDRPVMWYAWSYPDGETFGKPINLAESFFKLLDETKIKVNGDCETTILELVETLLAHPEEVKIHIQ